jgi:hypothetical protein
MRVSIITALLAESLLISILAVALPLFVTTLTVAKNRFSGEQTSLIFIDVFIADSLVLRQNSETSNHTNRLDERPNKST